MLDLIKAMMDFIGVVTGQAWFLVLIVLVAFSVLMSILFFGLSRGGKQ